MPASLEQSRRLVDTYAAQQANLITALVRILLTLWGRFPDWHDTDMQKAWAARSAVDVDVALGQARRIARAYMLTSLNMADAPPFGLPEVVETYERGGRAIVEVYKRPMRERNYVERTAIERGESPGDAAALAQKAFEERLLRTVEEDVMVTVRDETQKVIAASPKVTGYRRVIHPELSKTGVCGLCIVAADRLYSVAELMDMHPGCNCTVAEVTASTDPGLSLNTEDLQRVYDAAGSNTRGPLSNVRITSYEHGELGPMLINRGGQFMSLSEVNRNTKRAEKATPYKRMTREAEQTNWRAMKATSERSIRYLLNAKSRGTDMVDLGTGRARKVADIDAAVQYHRDLIARAARHAA